MKKKECTDDKWDEAEEEIISEKLLEGEVGYEPTDEEIWERLHKWNNDAYDDYADQCMELEREERDNG